MRLFSERLAISVEISILNRRKSIHHEEHEGKLNDKDGIGGYIWIDNPRVLHGEYLIMYF
jgi:hypothetical protein